MTPRRFWIRLQRFLRRRVFGRPVPSRDSEKSRRDLLDEVFLLRDVAGDRLHKIVALQERIAFLERRLAISGREPSRLTAGMRSAAVNETTLPEGPDQRQDATPLLFVDVSELALKAGQTGIQRLVREIFCALAANPPAGYRVEAVRAAPGEPYRYARSFTRRMGMENEERPDALIEAKPGDVFLGLDHAMYAVIANAAQLAAIRDRGARMWFVCNDVLPLTQPEWFPPEVQVAFKAWIETLARIADGIACISQTTEVELRRHLQAFPVTRDRALRLGSFQLGGDIAVQADVAAITPDEEAVMERLRGTPSFLVVGTIEPRKGHAQTLEAFEELWAEGQNVMLVLVGHPGWMTDVTQRRIRHHDELGKRLFWFMHASDASVARLYETCTTLLAPSEGEGFGLPLVEAARHGLPILCRDLPVFREVAGDHASYFNGLDAVSLVTAVREWLIAYRGGHVPSSTGMPTVTWSESAAQLAQLILDRPPEPAQSRQPHGVHA